MAKYLVLQFSGEAVGLPTTHAPEVTGMYNTFRNGELQEFTVCGLRVGDRMEYTDSRGVTAEYEIIVNDLARGDVECPDEYTFVARLV